MRVMLAKLLLEKPSLLMLDEPTNHLDLPSIEWVENYLRNYDGAVIIVSHDRKFIDNVVSKTVDVTQQQLITYEGNYSFYLREKELRENIQQNAFENQQAKIRQAERFIERFKAKASKARQVKSKEKAIGRMDLIEEVAVDSAAVNFKFKFKQPSGRHVVTLNDVSKAYGTQEILHHTNAIIERGDKIALIGANGKGKSTLLRILSGTEPVQGNRVMGYNVIQGFYAQHQLEALNTENEILDELKQAGSGKLEQELRGILGCFLFTDEDQFKKIKVLSGGEKSRVALAKTLISEANFLLLDEPTNHLDFISENILIQALQQYLGSFVVVSHNRYFISQIANKIWYIDNHQIKVYPGTYDEFEYWSHHNPQHLPPPLKAKEEKTTKGEAVKTVTTLPADGELKKLSKELKATETQIEGLESEKARIESALGKPEIYGSGAELADEQLKLSTVTKEIQELSSRWEQLVNEIDGLDQSRA